MVLATDAKRSLGALGGGRERGVPVTAGHFLALAEFGAGHHGFIHGYNRGCLCCFDVAQSGRRTRGAVTLRQHRENGFAMETHLFVGKDRVIPEVQRADIVGTGNVIGGQYRHHPGSVAHGIQVHGNNVACCGIATPDGEVQRTIGYRNVVDVAGLSCDVLECAVVVAGVANAPRNPITVVNALRHGVAERASNWNKDRAVFHPRYSRANSVRASCSQRAVGNGGTHAGH